MYDGESQQYSYQSYQPYQPYQPPMVHHPLQLSSAPQLLQYQPPPLPPPIQQLEDQQDKGFRLFGKKRSKTQPSATQPPEIGPLDNPNGHAPYGAFMNQGNDLYSAPLMVPGEAPSGPPVIISPIFMSQPSVKNSSSQDPSNKSKWRPFGKKKSKSFSSHEALSTNLVQDGAQVMPSATLVPAAQSAQHLVDPGDHADAYRAQADWYVENNPGNGYDDYDNPDAYYDEEDEDVDPYYIADTKGRAQAFEGKVTKAPSPRFLKYYNTLFLIWGAILTILSCLANRRILERKKRSQRNLLKIHSPKAVNLSNTAHRTTRSRAMHLILRSLNQDPLFHLVKLAPRSHHQSHWEMSSPTQPTIPTIWSTMQTTMHTMRRNSSWIQKNNSWAKMNKG